MGKNCEFFSHNYAVADIYIVIFLLTPGVILQGAYEAARGASYVQECRKTRNDRHQL